MEIVDKYQRIAPENAGIYFFVQLYGWYAMDEIYRYAESNQKELLYHPLRWWYGEQPADYQAWIIEAMTRYPGINDWVVVNEGWDYNGCNPTVPFIEESFQLARSVRPGATLWYNGLLFSQCEQELAIGLVQDGLADAIGVQMHHSLDTDLDLYRPLLSWLEDNGVQWAITELDVIIPAYTPSYLGLQAEAYGKAVDLYLEYSGAWITTWGVSDNHSWLSWNYPLPFDSSYQPKPAWAALFGGE
jgi:endo-1,4-beta-xylanase